MMSFTPEELQRGAELVAVGDEALRAAVPAWDRDAVSIAYRPLLMAVAAMLLRAKASGSKRPAGFAGEVG